MSNVLSFRNHSRLAARWRAVLPLTVALLLIVAACGGGKEATPAPSPTAAPVATATPAPTPTTRVTAPTPGPPPSPTPAPPTPTPSAKYGGVLSLGAGGDWGHLDTHQKPDLLTRTAAAPGYDGILQLDGYNDNVIIPDLAERWELAADGKTLTLFFRKGVKFHDGAPFTADDVLYNITLFRDPPAGTAYRFSPDWKNVQEAVAVDEATVRVKLERHSNVFLQRVATADAPMFQKQAASRDPANAMKNTVLGTGPFKLKEYRRAIGLEYVRNAGYWLKGRPFLDGIQFTIFSDSTAATAALRTGRIDMQCGGGICSIDPELQERIIKESGGKLILRTTPAVGAAVIYLAINPKVKPYDDPRARTAINLAIDRRAWINSWPNGSHWLFIGPGTPFTRPQEEISKLPGYRPDKTADIAEAKRLLKEAGLESGFTMTVYTRNTAAHVGGLEILGQQLKPLNITVKITPEAFAPFLERAVKSDYGVVCNAAAPALGDPTEYFGFFVTGEQVPYDDPALKRLVTQQDAEPDLVKRKALVRQIEDQLYRDAYMLYLISASGGKGGGSLVWSYYKNLPTAGSTGNNASKQLEVWLDK